MYYKLLDHTADILIEAEAPSLHQTILMLARGMIHAVTDYKHRHSSYHKTCEFSFEFTNYEDLIIRILSELKNQLYDSRQIPVDVSISFCGHTVLVVIGYIIVPQIKFCDEVKAVTYHDFELRQAPGSVYARVLFDV
jgi:SHS2 domain-containing protein